MQKIPETFRNKPASQRPAIYVLLANIVVILIIIEFVFSAGQGFVGRVLFGGLPLFLLYLLAFVLSSFLTIVGLILSIKTYRKNRKSLILAIVFINILLGIVDFLFLLLITLALGSI